MQNRTRDPCCHSHLLEGDLGITNLIPFPSCFLPSGASYWPKLEAGKYIDATQGQSLQPSLLGSTAGWRKVEDGSPGPMDEAGVELGCECRQSSCRTSLLTSLLCNLRNNNALLLEKAAALRCRDLPTWRIFRQRRLSCTFHQESPQMASNVPGLTSIIFNILLQSLYHYWSLAATEG